MWEFQHMDLSKEAMINEQLIHETSQNCIQGAKISVELYWKASFREILFIMAMFLSCDERMRFIAHAFHAAAWKLKLRHWNQKFHTKKEWTLTFERLFHDFFVIKLSICMHFANFHGGFNNPNFPRKYFHPIWIICGPYLGFVERLYKYVLIILNFTFGEPVFWCFWSN